MEILNQLIINIFIEALFYMCSILDVGRSYGKKKQKPKKFLLSVVLHSSMGKINNIDNNS